MLLRLPLQVVRARHGRAGLVLNFLALLIDGLFQLLRDVKMKSFRGLNWWLRCGRARCSLWLSQRRSRLRGCGLLRIRR